MADDVKAADSNNIRISDVNDSVLDRVTPVYDDSNKLSLTKVNKNLDFDVYEEILTSQFKISSKNFIPQANLALRPTPVFAAERTKIGQSLVANGGSMNLASSMRIISVFMIATVAALFFTSGIDAGALKNMGHFITVLHDYNVQLFSEMADAFKDLIASSIGSGMSDAADKIAVLFAKAKDADGATVLSEAAGIFAATRYTAGTVKDSSETTPSTIALEKTAQYLYKKDFTDSDALEVANLLTPYLNGGTMDFRDAKNVAYVIRHLFINPSTTSSDIASKLNVDMKRLKTYYKLIRESKECQALFNKSVHGRFIRILRMTLSHDTFLAKFLTAQATYPVDVEIHPSDSCNFRCPGCIDRYKKALFGIKDEKPQIDPKDWPRLKKALHTLHELGAEKVTIAGAGEPSLGDLTLDVMRESKEMKMATFFFSNGSVIMDKPDDDKPGETVENIPIDDVMGLDVIKISIDAVTAEQFSQAHFTQRDASTDAMFEQVKEQVRRIVAAKEEMLRKNPDAKVPRIEMNMIVTDKNYVHIPAYAEQAAHLGVDAVRFNHDFWGSVDKLDSPDKAMEKSMLSTFIKGTKHKYGDRVKVDFSSRLERVQAEEEGIYFEHLRKADQCRFHRWKIAIDKNLDVWVCSRSTFDMSSVPAHHMGNLKQHDIKTILDNYKDHVYPEQCRFCPPYEDNMLTIFDKLGDDMGDGIAPEDQPFAPIYDVVIGGIKGSDMNGDKSTSPSDLREKIDLDTKHLVKTDKKIILQLGAGRFGKFITEELLEANGNDYHLVVIAGSNIDELKETLANEIEAGNVTILPKAFKDSYYRLLLKDERVKAVVIATPPETHFSLAYLAVNQGVPIYVEKPMVMRSEEAAQLVELAEANAVPMQVGYIQLHNPYMRAMKKLVDNRDFGYITDIDFTIENEYPSKGLDNVGALRDWAPHLLSALYYVLGDIEDLSVLSVKAGKKNEAGNPDRVELKLSGKIRGAYANISMTIDRKADVKRNRVFTITGTEGTARLNFNYDLDQQGTFTDSNHHSTDFTELMEPEEQVSNLTREISTFVDCVDGKKNWEDVPGSGQFGKKVVTAIDMMNNAVKRAESIEKDAEEPISAEFGVLTDDSIQEIGVSLGEDLLAGKSHFSFDSKATVVGKVAYCVVSRHHPRYEEFVNASKGGILLHKTLDYNGKQGVIFVSEGRAEMARNNIIEESEFVGALEHEAIELDEWKAKGGGAHSQHASAVEKQQTVSEAALDPSDASVRKLIASEDNVQKRLVDAAFDNPEMPDRYTDAQIVAGINPAGKLEGAVVYRETASKEQKTVYNTDADFGHILSSVVLNQHRNFNRAVRNFRLPDQNKLMQKMQADGLQAPGNMAPVIVDVQTLLHNPGWIEQVSGLNMIFYAADAAELKYLEVLGVQAAQIVLGEQELNEAVEGVAADKKADMIVIGDVPVSIDVKNSFKPDASQGYIDWEMLKLLILNPEQQLFLPMILSNRLLDKAQRAVWSGV